MPARRRRARANGRRGGTTCGGSSDGARAGPGDSNRRCMSVHAQAPVPLRACAWSRSAIRQGPWAWAASTATRRRAAGRRRCSTGCAATAARTPARRTPLADVTLLAPVPEPPSVRDFFAFEGHVATGLAAARRRDPAGLVRGAGLLLLQPRLDPRAGGGRCRARRRRSELDFELEIAAVIGARRRDRGLHAAQRLQRARRPARGDDGRARAGQGQGLRDRARPVARHARRAAARGRPAAARGDASASTARS